MTSRTLAQVTVPLHGDGEKIMSEVCSTQDMQQG